ncbi:flagellin [Fodinicurvata halophila]|uniref:flagellin n=1 Tax=Fodinicurvata halophila TaxID=1419723 RepID=UPI00362B2097
MIQNSINTNSGAMVALQNMNKTNSELSQVQNRVSTGLRVATAQDDGASFAIAQGLRSDIKGIGAVNEQISKAKGLVSTTLSSLTSVSDGLGDIRETLTKMADENNSPNSSLSTRRTMTAWSKSFRTSSTMLSTTART